MVREPAYWTAGTHTVLLHIAHSKNYCTTLDSNAGPTLLMSKPIAWARVDRGLNCQVGNKTRIASPWRPTRRTRHSRLWVNPVKQEQEYLPRAKMDLPRAPFHFPSQIINLTSTCPTSPSAGLLFPPSLHLQRYTPDISATTTRTHTRHNASHLPPREANKEHRS